MPIADWHDIVKVFRASEGKIKGSSRLTLVISRTAICTRREFEPRVIYYRDNFK